MRKIPNELKLKCCICGKPKSCSYDGKQYCNKHYQSMYRYGQPYGRPKARTNTYEIQGDILYITTAKGQVILADAEDLDVLSKHSWCISKTGYPVANINGKAVKLHRYLLGLTDPKDIVDHKNRNPLDNRKSNLRRCTFAENARNKSGKNGYIGIRLTNSNRYQVRITVNRKEVHIGNYKTLEDALIAREMAEKKYHGEFGSLNGVAFSKQ